MIIISILAGSYLFTLVWLCIRIYHLNKQVTDLRSRNGLLYSMLNAEQMQQLEPNPAEESDDDDAPSRWGGIQH